MSESEEICIFQDILDTCKDGPVVKISDTRLESVKKSSTESQDSLLSSNLLGNVGALHSHKSCLSTYISSTHIQRHLKRKSFSSSVEILSPPKVSLRSSTKVTFDVNKHCIFCGNECRMTPDPKHPDRWNKATLCRTADRGESNKSFKEVILTTCDKRNDEVANQVRIKIQGAISDLHASNGRYHDKCKNNFMASRSIASASRKDADENPNDTAFSNLISHMVSNASHIWSSIELHNIYKYLGSSVSRKYLINQVKEYFGEHLITLITRTVHNVCFC